MYFKYSVPMHRRDTNASTNSNRQCSLAQQTETINSNITNGKRTQRERILPPSIETVTNACKRIKLVNSQHRTSDHKPIALKRQHVETNGRMECETIETTLATKRKKINWP